MVVPPQNPNPGRKKRFVIGIAGGSGSGKTTLATRLMEECRKIGIDSSIFALDNYYKPLGHLTFEERKLYNFDHPDAIDSELAIKQLWALYNGNTVQQPIYDFKCHTRDARTTEVKPTSLIIVEGLYTLYYKGISNLCDYKIFVNTGMVTACLRRIVRDVKERGRTVEDIKRQILETVLPMYEAYGRPTQRNAHFSINWEGEEIPRKTTEGLVRMLRDHFR